MRTWASRRATRKRLTFALLLPLLVVAGPPLLEGRTEGRAECRARRRVGRVQSRPRAAAVTGALDVASRTTGAQLFVDGLPVGKLPLAKPLALPVGQHTVKLTKDGYTQYLDVVEVAPGATVQVAVDLLPVAGVLDVKANVADARVFVDGRFVGFAPLEVELDVGPRAIRVTKAGYRDVIVARKAVAGQRTTLDVGLELLPAGSTPYRPLAPRVRWYERWYVWAGAAGGVAAVTVAVLVPVLAAGKDSIAGFGAEHRWRVP
ncbi:MAG: PEGA domain-containing protein [Proteobacteria bacterium]|nr:PEGA domain-containing protein [Pseudomonadota bacterium]